MAELDHRMVAAELLLRPGDVVERERLAHDVGRKLEEDAAELPGGAQRLEGGVEAREDLRAELARRPVDSSALVHGRGVTQVGREDVSLHRMARHHPEGLHVHDESLGYPLGPLRDEVFLREPVVGRVDLDRVEVLGVVAEPLLAGAHAFRIPVLDERLVGPRARAGADAVGQTANASCSWRFGTSRRGTPPPPPIPCRRRSRANRSATSCWYVLGAYAREP